MAEQRNLVVIGGGIAGVSAAEAAHHQYPGAQITLLAGEAVPFYNKIALSTFAAGKRARRHMHFYPLDWLKAQGIDCLWDAPVRAINRQTRSVHLADGRTAPYDKLIIATGARPHLPPIPGIDAPGIAALWSLDDAAKLRTALPGAGSVAIIGAGVLGVEAAVEFAGLGKQVTLIEARSTVLPQHLNPKAAALYQQFLASRGVDVRTSASDLEVERRQPRWQLTINGGVALDADLVVVLAGVSPNTNLAREAGLNVGRGIVVDDRMATSDPHILACGNCAEHQGALALLWNPAKRQGEVAGTNAFEPAARYAPGADAVHVKTPEMPLFIGGRTGDHHPQDLVLEDNDGSAHRNLRIDRNGRLKGAVLLGNTDGSYAVEQALKAERRLPEEVLTHPSVDQLVAHLRAEGHEHRYDPETDNWVCQMCGFNFEGANAPEICPVCAVGKDQFLAA